MLEYEKITKDLNLFKLLSDKEYELVFKDWELLEG